MKKRKAVIINTIVKHNNIKDVNKIFAGDDLIVGKKVEKSKL